MVTVARFKQFLVGLLNVQPNSKPQEEDRYWGFDSALERMDGRLAREEYYHRLEVRLMGRADNQAAGGSSEQKRASKNELDASSYWRAEAQRAHPPLNVAHSPFRNSPSFHY